VAKLKDVAAYVRSKSAGPFWVTIDVFCGDAERFSRLSAAPGLQPAAVAAVYGTEAASVRVFADADLKVIKISFPRAAVQGSARDADSHAGQYFVPLLDVDVPG
jgi:hypothetical protein